MRVIVLYRPNSEHERSVTTFQRDYQFRTGNPVELVSLDTPEGDGVAKVYDVTSYPAVLVLAEDGSIQQLWQGEPLPLINDVAGYAIH